MDPDLTEKNSGKNIKFFPNFFNLQKYFKNICQKFRSTIPLYSAQDF
jgi:hypothetical protein